MAWLASHGVRQDLAWFIAGGAVFLGLTLTALVALRRDSYHRAREAVVERCRFHRLDRRAGLWAAGATVAVLALTVLVQLILQRTLPGFSPQPPFMHMTALAPNERWVLLAWLPMFVLNILGEELLWHGYVLPRNVARFGPRAWLVNGTGWLLFHLPFGAQLLLLLLPIVFIETWAVQKSGNTWVGVIIHAVVNGPAFVAIALGAV